MNKLEIIRCLAIGMAFTCIHSSATYAYTYDSNTESVKTSFNAVRDTSSSNRNNKNNTDIYKVWDSVHEKTKTIEVDGIDQYDKEIKEVLMKSDGTFLIMACDRSQNNKADDSVVYIHNIDTEGNEIKTMKLKRELPRVGGIGIDDKDNMYIAYGDSLDEDQWGETVLRLVKYDENGKRLASYDLKSGDGLDTIDSKKIAFDAGGCDIKIENGVVSCLLAREMFQSSDGLNHQASYSFAVSADDLSLIEDNITYCSHSFEQKILCDGKDIIFIDRGDGYPRGFQLTKWNPRTDRYSVCVPFEFKMGPGGLNHDTDRIDYNYTFSELGGLFKLKNKYMLFGTYENATKDPNRYSSRNLFTQLIDLDFDSYDRPIYHTDFSDIDNGKDYLNEMTNVYNPVGFEMNNCYGIVYDVEQRNHRINYYKDDYEKNIIFFDENGKVIDTVLVHKNKNSNLADDIFYNNTLGCVNWFSSEKNKLVMHILEECTGDNCPIVLSDYKDISNLSDSQTYKLQQMFDDEIITGYEDMTMRLDGNVTRAEFASMLTRKLSMKNLETMKLTFEDVPTTYWANPAIAALVNIGAINGVSSTSFEPDSYITCEQACKIIAETYNWTKDVDVEREGGYPRAYYRMADYKGLLDNVTAEQSEPISRMDLIEMLYAASEYFNAEDFANFASRDRETGSNWYWKI